MSFLNIVSTKLIEFLDSNTETILKNWWQNIHIHPSDIHINKIIKNGNFMLQLVKKALTDELNQNEIEIEQHARKVALERIQANKNIAEFITNINLGRKTIINHIFLAKITLEEIQQAIEQINYCFDQYCFFAIKHYTLLKEKEIEEKNCLIDETHKIKLSLLGQMSSSFVHEFRNPLTAVIGFIKLLKMEYPTLKYLDIIDHELDQLKFRITQFLHTSKNEAAQEQRKEKLTVHLLLEDIIQFLYPSIVDTDVNVQTCCCKTAQIIANTNELKQVFLNILMNSIDAVNKKTKPRKIIVSTCTKNNHVLIDISNNGPTIPSQIREIIFEPFFTTKELGTGIGLYVCKKIIEKHNGSIKCISNKDLTTFRICLPLYSNNNSC